MAELNRCAPVLRAVRAHMENIRRQLQVRSRAQIAPWVTEHRLGRARLGSSTDVPAGDQRRGHGQLADLP
jgi:hypothetical protein